MIPAPGSPGASRWLVEPREGDAAQLHSLDPSGVDRPTAWLCRFGAPALVLGSAQADRVVDHRALRDAGVELVRRRSGGGAVLLVPGDVVWIDLVLPAGDPLWVDDVGRAAVWVGEAWAGALAEVGVAAKVHEGPMVRPPWSDLVCFAGRASGEVTSGAAKVVGVSQRRTRGYARFQCAALLRWDPGALLGLLSLDPVRRAEALAAVEDAATGLPVAAEPLTEAFLAHLP